MSGAPRQLWTSNALTVGSPAVLLANLLREMGQEVCQWDPELDESSPAWLGGADTPVCPAVWIVATRHQAFKQFRFPAGSVVFDPFRYLSPQEGVEIVPVGIGQKITGG